MRGVPGAKSGSRRQVAAELRPPRVLPWRSSKELIQMSLFLSENRSNAPGLLWGKKRYELLVNGNSAPLQGSIEGAYGSPTHDSGEMSENPATDCVDTCGRWTTPHRVPKGFNLLSVISFLAGDCSQELRLLAGEMACLRPQNQMNHNPPRSRLLAWRMRASSLEKEFSKFPAEISAFSDKSPRIQSPKFSHQPIRRWSRNCNGSCPCAR